MGCEIEEDVLAGAEKVCIGKEPPAEIGRAYGEGEVEVASVVHGGASPRAKGFKRGGSLPAASTWRRTRVRFTFGIFQAWWIKTKEEQSSSV